MKIFLIISGVVVLIFIVVQLFAMYNQSDIETYPYRVEKELKNFEIRTYEARLFTSVKLPSSNYKKMSSKGSSVLAGYIFGGNESNEKIAMTSPVSMSLEDSMTVMFLVPKKYNKKDLPNPNESSVEFQEEPEKKMSVITFGGWADNKKIENNKQKLLAALEAEGVAYTDRFYFFGYNAPYEVFNRKNEVAVELPEEN